MALKAYVRERLGLYPKESLICKVISKSMELLKAEWVVDDEGDPGIAIKRLNIGIGYYKWSDTFIVRKLDRYKWRQAQKRELSRHLESAV